jgi:hypothetical protein
MLISSLGCAGRFFEYFLSVLLENHLVCLSEIDINDWGLLATHQTKY